MLGCSGCCSLYCNPTCIRTYLHNDNDHLLSLLLLFPTLILSSRPSYAGPASSRAADATARAAGMCWRADNTRAKRAQEGGWQPPEAFKAARQFVSAAGSWRPSACMTTGSHLTHRWDGVKQIFVVGQMVKESFVVGQMVKEFFVVGQMITRPW